jgi:hypothetical protein
MATTHFSGPLEIGEGASAGRPVEVITVPLTALAQANTDFTFTLPACRILRATERTTVAFTGATVNLQLGTAVGGSQLVAATDIKAQSAARALTLVAGAAATFAAFAGGTVHGRIVQTATETAVGAGDLYIEFVRTGDA